MSASWLFVLFNFPQGTNAFGLGGDVRMLHHRTVAETAVVLGAAGTRVGVILRADGRVEAEYAALDLADVCTVVCRVPPRFLLLESPGMPLDGAVRALAELPGTRVTGAAGLADLSPDVLRSLEREDALPVCDLLGHPFLRQRLWEEAVRVCRHDVVGTFRRLRELLLSEDGPGLHVYLEAHGGALLATLRLAGGKLAERGRRYFPGREEALAAMEVAMVSLESALAQAAAYAGTPGFQALHAALAAAVDSLSEPLRPFPQRTEE